MKQWLNRCLVPVILLQGACAAAPPPASLAQVHDRAAREVFAGCVRSGFGTHRHVPFRDLIHRCERMAQAQRAALR